MSWIIRLNEMMIQKEGGRTVKAKFGEDKKKRYRPGHKGVVFLNLAGAWTLQINSQAKNLV